MTERLTADMAPCSYLETLVLEGEWGAIGQIVSSRVCDGWMVVRCKGLGYKVNHPRWSAKCGNVAFTHASRWRLTPTASAVRVISFKIINLQESIRHGYESYYVCWCVFLPFSALK